MNLDDGLSETATKWLEMCIRDSFYVVAVPTPVDDNNRPDLRPLWGASETVGKVISKGDIVVWYSRSVIRQNHRDDIGVNIHVYPAAARVYYHIYFALIKSHP